MKGAVSKHLRELTFSAYVPVLFIAWAQSSITPAFPQYLSGLGAGVALVGLVVSMRGIGQAASDVPGGLAIPRWGLKRVTTVAFVLAAVANGWLIFVTNVALIALLVFVSGFFTSILMTSFMTLIRASVPVTMRGRALAMLGGALRVGMLLGPIAGGAIAGSWGVPALFALRSASLVAGLVSFLVRFPADAVTEGRNGASTVFRGMRRLAAGLRGRWFALATVGFSILILSILRSTREIILPMWGDRIGLEVTTIGVVMSIGAAFDLILFLPSGSISDRYGRKAAAGLCLGIFRVGLFILLPAQSAVGFVVAVALIGAGNGFGAGINMTTGTDLAPDGAVAEFLGIWRLYGDIGSAIGPVVVGSLTAGVALTPAVATVAAAGLVGTAVMVLVAPETLMIAHGGWKRSRLRRR